MRERRCGYCQKSFRPSKFQPLQTVCDEAVCQRQRRTDYHRQKIAADPEYRDVCRDSQQKWRERHPDHWQHYRTEHPDVVARNRDPQKFRDRRQHLRNLANNTSALDPKAFRSSGLAGWGERPGPCKQQLGYGPSVGNRSTCATSAPPASVLQTTSFWRANRFCRINKDERC